jgi:hypothetical protein
MGARMIHRLHDLLDDMIIPIGETIKGLDLDEDAKVTIFVRYLEEIVNQAKEAEHEPPA